MTTAAAGLSPQQGLPHPFAFQKQGLRPFHQPNFSRTEPPSTPRDTSSWLNTKPYNPFINGQALLRAGLITALGFGLAFIGSRRLWQKTFRRTQHEVEKQLAENLKKATQETLDNPLPQGSEALTHKTTFLNFQNPILSLMTMANDHRFWPVAGLYGLTSVGGYLLSSALKGAQAAWVRDEQTQLRMQAMNKIANIMTQSMTQKEAALEQLRQNTQQAIAGLLKRHGIDAAPYLSTASPLPRINPSVRRNFLQEIRPESILDNNPNLLSPTRLSGETLMAKSPTVFGKHASNPTPLTNDHNPQPTNPMAGLNILDPVFLGIGSALGFASQGVKRTCQQLVSVLQSSEEAIEKQALKLAQQGMPQPIKRALTITLKDSEALVMLLSDMGKTRLLVGMGLLMGAFGAGKLLIDGLREIKVFQQNAKAEVNYQRYNWQTLGVQLQRTAEETWLTMQLSALDRELPQLKQNPSALKARTDGIIGHIGLNSPPSYYTTPIEFNEPYYWHYADN